MRLVCLCPTYARAPQPLETAIACFLSQTYKEARLLILDDSGLLPAQSGERWEVITVPERYASLPLKYEALVGLAGDDWDAAIVWEDDDVYLPWHLSTYAAALEKGPWAHPPEVYAHSAQGLHHVYATGNRHGALGVRRDGVEVMGRWSGAVPEDRPTIATWDQLAIAKLTEHAPPVDPTGPRGPSYVYRWGTSGAINMTALMQSNAEDEGLWSRAEKPPTRPARAKLEPQLDSIAAEIVEELSGESHAEAVELTIAIVARDDFGGVYSTVQSLRLGGVLGSGVEVLIADRGDCARTRELAEQRRGLRYVHSAAAYDAVFAMARGAAVVCCDSGTLFEPGAIAALREFFKANDDSTDLIQGPRLSDDRDVVWTHLDPGWTDQMWGVPASDPRGSATTATPFEIEMQDLRVFACRRDAWPGVSSSFRGSLGGAGYLPEKFRRAGRRCVLHPALRWVHPSPAVTSAEDRLHDYLVARSELGQDIADVLAHFAESMHDDRLIEVTQDALSRG